MRGGAWVGQHAGTGKLVTLDIGGTSADIGIIRDGRLAEADARSASIADFPVMLPMIDIHTIGAGGGSIAHLDRGSAFRVGPQLGLIPVRPLTGAAAPFRRQLTPILCSDVWSPTTSSAEGCRSTLKLPRVSLENLRSSSAVRLKRRPKAH